VKAKQNQISWFFDNDIWKKGNRVHMKIKWDYRGDRLHVNEAE
jgi:hypothetical protein